ncbi:hypothetical protein [Ralstonia solanacearum]|uniref:hypothetical protein n=1 Tax=Ralstonia solanacearum TaxID=305 RepID=UPI00078D197A|nr:hypothetical protein [Ralstonia solanacearum]AMP36823.1 hypothetical protein LBM2029_04390 [Ralstonia solanacearum]AXV85629.1 hypothetical protein CJO78_04580 [Ralstonia solanacearum]AXW05138.1 hypothetical protein CJO82_04355 [Ralstonia solanacearum]AXW22882.1 hypothetical protein CJO86_04380 [Ralstonia solanacearum]AXW79829.1 hypothetical protein CJO98_04600 [Ralstonia solanacearum]
MQTTTPQLSPDLKASLEAYQDVRKRFEAARDEAGRIDADLQKHRKAAEAAEAEAQQARLNAAELMRNPVSSMKDIHQLKAKERASYTLSEDYRAIVAEFQIAHDEAMYQAGAIKFDEGSAYGGLLQRYADALMHEAGQLVTPLFHAIRVQELANAYAAARGKANWEYTSDSARSAALSRIYGVIERGFSAFKFDSTSDAVLRVASRPAGLDRIKEVSPVKQRHDRVLREQATARQRDALSQPTQKS